MTFDGSHLAGEPGKDRGLIPGARANLEHAMLRLRSQQFGHNGHDVRLGDGLPVRDRERAILVRVGPLGVGNEKMPGNFSKCLQDPCVANATSSDLALDHLDAQFAVVHNHSRGALPLGLPYTLPPSREARYGETSPEPLA